MPGRYVALCFIALVACGDGSAEGEKAVAGGIATSGPDPIVLRIARGGGTVRAFRYPRLDSLLWTSTQSVAAPGAVLAFDQEDGIVAYQDQNGLPGWIDLRLGTFISANKEPRTKLALIAAAEASAIYGVARDTLVRRMTQGGEWSFAAGGKVAALYPQPNGALVVLVNSEKGDRLLRLRPPEPTVSDSARVVVASQAVGSPLGDRLYFATGPELISLNANTFAETGRTRFGGEIVALATTPSGDRVLVATERSHAIEILNRYGGQRGKPYRMPGAVRELRMDPLGRLLLVRPDSGDLAWVVSIGTGQLVGTVVTKWRGDLPTVAADGSVVTVNGRNVDFVVPGQTRPRMRVREGANEFWHFVFWNGFRPRAKGLPGDQPVVFQEDSASYGFTTALSRDSAPPPQVATVDTSHNRPVAPRDTVEPAPSGREVWTVSFYAVLSEERAQTLSQGIAVDGQKARVTVSETEGVRVYRVVLGPYPTRADAERVGRSSRRQYWVFEGAP